MGHEGVEGKEGHLTAVAAAAPPAGFKKLVEENDLVCREHPNSSIHSSLCAGRLRVS